MPTDLFFNTFFKIRTKGLLIQSLRVLSTLMGNRQTSLIWFNYISGLLCADDSSQNPSALAEALVCGHVGHLHRRLLEDRRPLSHPQPQTRGSLRRDLYKSCW